MKDVLRKILKSKQKGIIVHGKLAFIYTILGILVGIVGLFRGDKRLQEFGAIIVLGFILFNIKFVLNILSAICIFIGQKFIHKADKIKKVNYYNGDTYIGEMSGEIKNKYTDDSIDKKIKSVNTVIVFIITVLILLLGGKIVTSIYNYNIPKQEPTNSTIQKAIIQKANIQKSTSSFQEKLITIDEVIDTVKISNGSVFKDPAFGINDSNLESAVSMKLALDKKVKKVYFWKAKHVEGKIYFVSYDYDYDYDIRNGYKSYCFEVNMANSLVTEINGNPELEEKYRNLHYIN